MVNQLLLYGDGQSTKQGCIDLESFEEIRGRLHCGVIFSLDPFFPGHFLEIIQNFAITSLKMIPSRLLEKPHGKFGKEALAIQLFCFLVDAVVERSRVVTEKEVNFFELVRVSSKIMEMSLQEQRPRVFGLEVLSVFYYVFLPRGTFIFCR